MTHAGGNITLLHINEGDIFFDDENKSYVLEELISIHSSYDERDSSGTIFPSLMAKQNLGCTLRVSYGF